jgi:hypothetical protein
VEKSCVSKVDDSVLLHRNRLLGQWAAAALRLRGPEKEAYVADLVDIGSGCNGSAEVLAKIAADFTNKGIRDFHPILDFKQRCLLEASRYQLEAS